MILQLVAAAASSEAQHTVGAIIKQAASYLLALTVLGAFAWRLLRPHFDKLVRNATATREATEGTRSDLADVPHQLQALTLELARLADLPLRVARVEGRVDTLEAAVMGVQPFHTPLPVPPPAPPVRRFTDNREDTPR